MDTWNTQHITTVMHTSQITNTLDLASHLSNVSTYSITKLPTPQKRSIRLKLNIAKQNLKVRREVKESLDKSLREHAQIWTELSKY